MAQRDLYFSTQDVDQLYNFGTQGEWIARIIEIPEVAESIRLLNILNMKDPMFPRQSPLAMFTDFDMEDCKFVVVGGAPALSHLKDWLGSGYSYNNGSKLFSTFHQRLLDDFSMYDKISMKPSLYHLRTRGALLLHEVLSTASNNLSLCLKLWEPFIWQLLHKISVEMPTVPIVFATNLADAKFNTAVIGSKHVFRINIMKETKADGIPVFPMIQKIINKGVKFTDEVDIMIEAKR